MRKFLSVFSLLLVVLMLSVSSVAAQPGKSDICHKSGDSYSLLNVSNKALAGHMSHGDGLPGAAVPNMAGYEFDEVCGVVLTPVLNFIPFYIRNTGSTIAPPWDPTLVIAENAAGDGFSAQTPLNGQKVGYGTNYYDGLPINSVDSVDWTRTSGALNLVSYLNIWVTDGTNYAVIASENDYRGTNFATRTEWKVFEYNTTGGDSVALDWLCNGGDGGRVSQYLTCNGVNASLSSIPSNVIISSPTTYPAYVGTGAPRGGRGFNLIWGDTSANFLGPYSLNALSVTVGGVISYPSGFDAPSN